MDRETAEALKTFKASVKGIEEEADVSGCQFVAVLGYTNQKGEVSNQVFNAGIDHQKVLAADRKRLLALQADAGRYALLVQQFGNALVNEAFDALLKSVDSCIAGENARSQAQKDAYVWINNGMKFSITTRRIMIFGQKVSKVVLVPGEYKPVKSRPLTLCKNAVKKAARTKGDDYRQFILELDKIEGVNIGGKKITFTVH